MSLGPPVCFSLFPQELGGPSWPLDSGFSFNFGYAGFLTATRAWTLDSQPLLPGVTYEDCLVEVGYTTPVLPAEQFVEGERFEIQAGSRVFGEGWIKMRV